MQHQRSIRFLTKTASSEDIPRLLKKVGNADPGDQVKFGVDPTGPTGGSLACQS